VFWALSFSYGTGVPSYSYSNLLRFIQIHSDGTMVPSYGDGTMVPSYGDGTVVPSYGDGIVVPSCVWLVAISVIKIFAAIVVLNALSSVDNALCQIVGAVRFGQNVFDDNFAIFP